MVAWNGGQALVEQLEYRAQSRAKKSTLTLEPQQSCFQFQFLWAEAWLYFLFEG